MLRRFKKLLSLLLLAAMLLTCLPAGLAEELEAPETTAEPLNESETEALEAEEPAAEEPAEEPAAIPDDYQKVAENSRFNLYLKEDNLSVIVESKASGKVLYSTVQDPENHNDNATWQGFYQSGVVMEYITGVQARTSQADFINTPHEITYAYRENGFTAHVTFTDIEISFDMNVNMTEEGFDVQIPQESIVEENAAEYNIRQSFLLEDSESATYAGLAVAYRNHLIAGGAFESAENRVFDVQIDFLGLERENYILGKTDVVMTTFDQASEIATDLTSKGVEHMTMTYRGWQTDGLTGGVPTNSFAPAKSLGGREGLENLRQRIGVMGSVLGLELDLLSLNTDTHPTLRYSALKEITSETWSQPTFGMAYDTLYYLTPTASVEQSSGILSGLASNNVKAVSLTGITKLVSGYYFHNEYHDATDMANAYAGIADTANDTLSTTLVRPNAYLWRYADAVSDMPIGGSDYTYTDAEIPFLSIAMSGQIPYYAEYTNFQANTQEFLLHLIEQGARPSFLLTWEDPIELQNTNSSGIYSSRYELYGEMIADWYLELANLHQAVGSEGMIVNHEHFGDLVRVTWDNGTRVYLNFGDFPGELDGVQLASMSYKVVNGNGN